MSETDTPAITPRSVASTSATRPTREKRLLSVRTWILLLIALAVIVAAISWPAFRRWQVIRAIEKDAGFVGFTDDREWLTDWFGEAGRPFRDVRTVQVRSRGPGSLGLQVLREVHVLQWIDPTGVSQRDIVEIHGLDELAHLYLYESAFTDEVVSDILRGAPKLTNLKLIRTGASRLTMQAICRIPSIERIIFTAAHVEDADFVGLNPLPNLTEIAIGDSRIGDHGMEWLSHSARLTMLEVMHGEVTDNGLRHLASLHNLSKLWLVWCPDITDAGIAHLEGHPNLAELFVPAACVTPRFIESLRTMPSLRTIQIDGTIADPELREILDREWHLENEP